MLKTISKPHTEILDEKRRSILELLVKNFSGFVLGGGTAAALLIKHRKSYDFDFFSAKPVSRKLMMKVNKVFEKYAVRTLVDTADELSILLDNRVKVSFIYYPFKPLHPLIKKGNLSLFSLKDLASAKAYTIGRRGIWRDYVDLFFLLRSGLKLKEIIKESQKRFRGNFDEKLFLEQLIYFGDIFDFSADFLGKNYNSREIEDYFIREVKKIKI
jgi:hypothetical protein